MMGITHLLTEGFSRMVRQRAVGGAHHERKLSKHGIVLDIEDIHVKLIALSKDTGYELTQINGQRRFGPPPDWKGPRPPRGSELFIGGLPRNVFEYDLVPLFSKYGTIYEMRLMMEFSGENKGYGFVTMGSRWEASIACSALNHYEVRPGRYIGVVPSMDNRRLFLGGIPKHMQKDEILETAVQLVDGVQDVIMYPNVENKRLGRGYVFLEFESHKAAAIAKRVLLSNLKELLGQQVIVQWADVEPYVDEVIMSKVTVIFMRNLLLRTNEATIKEQIISSAGGRNCVLKVKKIKDFAFIHFISREDAERALEFWNGRNMDGAIVETAWAKPPDKIRKFPKRRESEVILPSNEKRQLLKSLSCSKVMLTDERQSSLTAHVAHFAAFSKDSAPTHQAKTTQSWLHDNIPNLVSCEEWHAASPDLNPPECHLCNELHQRVCSKRHHNVDSQCAIVKEAKTITGLKEEILKPKCCK